MRFAHVGLTVDDLSRSARFYSDLFGFKTQFRSRRAADWLSARVGYHKADIEFIHMRSESGMHLELLKYHEPLAHWTMQDDTYIPGSMHFCLVVEDLEEMVSRIKHYTSIGDFGPMARFIGAADDLFSTRIPDGPNEGGLGFYMRDPDGHTIELCQEVNSGIPDELAAIIDRMEAARAKQNTNWMNIVRTIYRVAPEEGHRLFKVIEEQDKEIHAIAAESHR